MSIMLRIVLIIASIATTLYIMRKIRNSKAQIEDSIFWLILSFLLIILSLFPAIPAIISKALGFAAPVNFLFIFMIFVLLVKIFTMSLKVSMLETKLRNLTQEIAIRQKQSEESENTDEKEDK